MHKMYEWVRHQAIFSVFLYVHIEIHICIIWIDRMYVQVHTYYMDHVVSTYCSSNDVNGWLCWGVSYTLQKHIVALCVYLLRSVIWEYYYCFKSIQVTGCSVRICKCKVIATQGGIHQHCIVAVVQILWLNSLQNTLIRLGAVANEQDCVGGSREAVASSDSVIVIELYV